MVIRRQVLRPTEEEEDVTHSNEEEEEEDDEEYKSLIPTTTTSSSLNDHAASLSLNGNHPPLHNGNDRGGNGRSTGNTSRIHRGGTVSLSSDDDEDENDTGERQQQRQRRRRRRHNNNCMDNLPQLHGTASHHHTIANLNLDHLTNVHQQIRLVGVHNNNHNTLSSSTTINNTKHNKNNNKKQRSSQRSHSLLFYSTYYNRHVSCIEYIYAQIAFLFYYCSYTCAGIMFCLVLLAMSIMAYVMINPMLQFGGSLDTSTLLLQHHNNNPDHHTIPSMYDYEMGHIDHWCLGGGDTHCTCTDPLIPIHRANHKSWIEAWKSNRRTIQQYYYYYDNNNIAAPPQRKRPRDETQLDVVFLGESIIEEIDGRWMGRKDRSAGLTTLGHIFDVHFNTTLGHTNINGIALGIAGDTCPNVLWRLMHGEMPDYLQPKVWWLSLGNNDLGRTECSEEVVVIGILRVVEEILSRRPQAHVVINSLFPMTAERGGFYPLISDFEDSFIRNGGHDRDNGSRRRRTRALAVGTATPTTTSAASGIVTHHQQQRQHPPQPSRQQSHKSSHTGRRALRITNRSRQWQRTTEPPIDLEPDVTQDWTEEAEKEELARDQQAKMKQPMTKRTATTTRNPTMMDTTKVRKYQLNAAVVRESTKPLWTSIRAINKALKKFAETNSRVTYFDSMDIFTEKEDKTYTLLTDRISIRGHPTELGFELWEDAIVTKMEEILAVMKVEQPELFVESSSTKHSKVASSSTPSNSNMTVENKSKFADEVGGEAQPPDPSTTTTSSDDEYANDIRAANDDYEAQWKPPTPSLELPIDDDENADDEHGEDD